MTDEAVITIVKEQAFYVKSFVPVEYAGRVKVGQKMVVRYANRDIITHVTQILPSLDLATQRIVVLSSVDEKADDLYINAYVKSTLYFKADHKYVAVEKSALSFFNNEWVVFVSKEDNHNEGEEEGHDAHEEDEEKEHGTHEDEEHDEDEHGEHGEHEEHESAYEARVVEIVSPDDKYVGVKGLEVGEE
jgi:hypothetical protein